jgi:hypothetical protein
MTIGVRSYNVIVVLPSTQWRYISNYIIPLTEAVCIRSASGRECEGSLCGKNKVEVNYALEILVKPSIN